MVGQQIQPETHGSIGTMNTESVCVEGAVKEI